jgi:hypothetical protein
VLYLLKNFDFHSQPRFIHFLLVNHLDCIL